MNILVVDDSRACIEFAKHHLIADGHTVVTARDGLEALHYLRSNKSNVSLILLDVEMPNMNGYEVLRSIRADDRLKNLKVILVTAKDEESDKDWGLMMGADAYLCKPYTYEILKQTIEKIMGERGNHK